MYRNGQLISVSPFLSLFFHVRLQVLIKNMLYGTSDAEPQTEIVVSQLAQELYNSNLLLLLIQVGAHPAGFEIDQFEWLFLISIVPSRDNT